MSSTHGYQINSSKAISETLDGETIIINLENGNYYSMNETGSVLWNLVNSHASHSSILKHFLNVYAAPSTVVEKAINDLLTILKQDGLVLDDPIGVDVASSPSSPKKPFITPTIERYEDMQEMLLADPIHDVDEIGWPTLKKHK